MSVTMRCLRLLPLVLLIAVCPVTAADSDSEDSELSGGDAASYLDDDAGLSDGESDIWQFHVPLARGAYGSGAGPSHDNGAASSSSSGAPEEKRARHAGGRQPKVAVDEEEFAACVHEGYSEADLIEWFGCDRNRVNYLKRKLGLSTMRCQSDSSNANLPTEEELREMWTKEMYHLPVCASVVALAAALGLSTGALRRHMRKVNFSPKHPVPYEEVKAAVSRLMSEPCCDLAGATFMETRLRTECGIVARPALVGRALKELNPEGNAKRAKEAAKTRYQYTVGGPRGMYHMDGHEKIAKLWGIWVHGGIDGYSRFIIYLKAATNKRPETVRSIYVSGCNECGWPSRGRWDKGSENRLAILAQIDHHYDEARPQTLSRGSAITGKSTQNTRIEYLWRFVRVHVTGKFRSLFTEMRNLGLLNPTSEIDLFYLHAVFLPTVQAELDRFRSMWNEHPIRGDRTVAGHGGGIPSELFRDPVRDRVVLNDDQRYQRQAGTLGADAMGRQSVDETSEYGAEIAPTMEEDEMAIEELRTRDPLEFSQLLQQVRDAYISQHLLAITLSGVTPRSSTWEKMQHHVQAFIRYKTVCRELLACAISFWPDGQFDWHGFGSSSSPDMYSSQVAMRLELANIGVSLDV